MKLVILLLLAACSVSQQLPYDSVDCDNANGDPKKCTVEADEPNLPRGKLDATNSIYFTSDGMPYQCGPMSYYGAYCWQPDGIPTSPHSVKGYMWELVPEP